MSAFSYHFTACYNEYILIIAFHDIGCQYLIYCIPFLSKIVINHTVPPLAKKAMQKRSCKKMQDLCDKSPYSAVGGLYFGDMGFVWGVRFFMRPN